MTGKVVCDMLQKSVNVNANKFKLQKEDNMKILKKIASCCVSAILVGAMLGGCGKNADIPEEGRSAETAAADEQKSIYFVTAISGGFCFGPCEEGFQKACEEMGYEGHWVCPVTMCDTPQMVELCENALTEGADAIVVVALDDEPYSDVLTRAKEKGLAVVTVNTTISQDYTDAWIGTDPVGMGKTQAQAVMNAFDKSEEINLVYMQSDITATTQNLQFETVVSELTDNGYTVNVKDEWHCESQSDSSVASDLITALRKANPEINCAVLSDGYASTALASYIEENSVEDLTVVGIDDGEDCLKAVKAGTLNCTIVQDFYKIGYECVSLCDDILKDQSYVYDNDSGTSILYAEDVDAHAEAIGMTLQ